MKPNVFVWIVLVGQLVGGPSTGRAQLAPAALDRATVEAAGGKVIGRLEPASAEAAAGAALGSNAYVAFPTSGNFNPQRGTVCFRVQPAWAGNDGKEHAFFHLGDGNAHCTIFKTSSAGLRFVYKASPARYHACELSAADWQPGQGHHVMAGWVQNYAGDLMLLLEVDGRRVLESGAAVLDPVPATLFLGRRGPAAQPAEAVMASFRLSAQPPKLPYALGPKEPVVARVDASATQPLRRVHDFTTIWNSRSNPLPFGIGDPQYRRFVEAGFTMVRLVAFSEGWLWGTRVDRDPQGKLTTDFTDFDRLLDVFVAAGAEPYIRLAYHTPSVLTDPELPRKARAYALPQNLDEWDDLMARIVRHVRVERKLPVRYWVAALNEGDIPVRQAAAQPETIYRLYERTARIVRRIDPEAKVGGPALSRSVDGDARPAEMLTGFLRYCRDRELPLDFLCFHGYKKAHPREYQTLVEAVRQTAETEWPQRAKNLEYFLDEWNLWARDAHQDNEFAAAYLAAALQYQRRAGLTKSSIVAFNHFVEPSRRGGGPFVYNGETIARYAGLPLLKGPVVTAPYFVWLMHHRLAKQELAVDLPGRDGILADDSGGLTATCDDAKLSLLLWQFDLMRNEDRSWTIRVENLPAAMRQSKSLRLLEYRIDHDHTNPYTDYVLKGTDSRQGKYNLEDGTLEIVRRDTIDVDGSTAILRLTLPNMSVAQLELTPQTGP